MSTSMGHDLDARDPEARRPYSAPTPPDIYREHVKQMEAVSDAWSARMRAKREVRKQRRDVG